jgi:hypothetical protein
VALPTHIVWNLQISTRTRISLIAVLGLGFMYVFVFVLVHLRAWLIHLRASAAAIVRMPMIYNIVDEEDPFV